MSPTCPSDLALEAHLLDPQASKLGGHLAACAACAARVAAMERQGEEFRRFVFPATVEKVEAAARGGRRGRGWLLAAVPVLAAVVAVVLLRPAAQPDEAYLGLKGDAGGVGLAVFARVAGGPAHAVTDGGRIAAAAELRFRVRTAAPCRLVVLSVDATGQVSRLFGTSAGDLAPGTHDLQGGAVLDGKPGPERFFAVCPGDLRWEEPEASARETARGGEAALRRSTALRGPAARLAQATVLVEKDAP